MRTDREQLELIVEKKAEADRRRRRSRKIGFAALSLALCLCIVAASVVFANRGGFEKVFGGTKGMEGTEMAAPGAPKSGAPAEGHKSDVPAEGHKSGAPAGGKDGVIGASDGESRVDREGKAPLCDDAHCKEDETHGSASLAKPEAVVPEGSSGTWTNLSAGTLTGAELTDNMSYAEWLKALGEKGWKELQNKWKLCTGRRICVSGAPLCRAELVGKDGKALRTAVTDHSGKAYFFPGEQDSFSQVRLTVGDKTYARDNDGSDSYGLDTGERAEFRAEKLDLMFVIDTTGSMADELEYLKAEISDVIGRIDAQNVAVRTSVNFYRDEGDEYVVKYHGFYEDAKQVRDIVEAQCADGGGDFPEAVHTALDNAVNDHDWAEDSVKLLFLVLDAPPHFQPEVVSSLADSIAKAAELGIRVVPVASSGIDEETEFILRSAALLTGGSYTFLTDDSGIGGEHLAPSTSVQYEVERLNDMLVRIAMRYCGVEIEKQPISGQEQSGQEQSGQEQSGQEQSGQEPVAEESSEESGIEESSEESGIEESAEEGGTSGTGAHDYGELQEVHDETAPEN